MAGQTWKPLREACLFGCGLLLLDLVAVASASCESVLSNRNCLLAGDDGMPLSLLQHRAREAAAGKATAGQKTSGSGDVTGKEEHNYPHIHYVPTDQSLHSYLALDATNHYMDLSNVVQNNLGGKGPDSGAEEIRYRNVYPGLTNSSVDLVVTASSGYTPKASDANNGVIGKVGSINMRGGENTTFHYRLVDSFDDSKPVVVKKLLFSYYDVDNHRKELGLQISTRYFEKAYLSSDTAIKVVPQSSTSPAIFHSSAVNVKGFKNTDDLANLSAEQKRHAVTFSFLLVSEWEVTFSIPHGSRESGRNFFFSGVPVFEECISNSETAGLTLEHQNIEYSNFGGHGPDLYDPQGMRINKVFKFKNGTVVDLVVKNIDEGEFEYVPRKPNWNGAEHGFGRISMKLGSKAKFHFRFIDHMTGESVTMKDLKFSWFDPDGNPDLSDYVRRLKHLRHMMSMFRSRGLGRLRHRLSDLHFFSREETTYKTQQKVIMGGPLGAFKDVWVSNTTGVVVTPMPDGTTEFASSAGREGNPTDPAMVSAEQEQRAFTVSFGAVSEFTAIIDFYAGGWKPLHMPRSLFFNGVSRLNNAEDADYCL